MTWTARTTQLGLLPLIFIVLMSAALSSCRKGDTGGVFAFDQEAHISSFAPELPASVIASWRADLSASNLKPLLDARPESCPEVLCEVAEHWLDIHGGHRVLVGSNYRLSPAADALTDLLEELHLHALPRARFQVDAIEELLVVLQQAPNDDSWLTRVSIEEPLLGEAGAHFREHSPEEGADLKKVAAWIAKSDKPAIKSVREAYEEETSELEQQANALEWLLTLAWLEYVDIMNASNVDYWDEETLLEIGLAIVHPHHVVSEDDAVDPDRVVSEEDDDVVTMPKTLPASRARVRPSKIVEMTNTLRSRRLREEVEVLATDTLRERAVELEPPFEHYAALKQAFANYLVLAAVGGWRTDLQFSRTVRVGRRYSELPSLRERLRAEGFVVELSDSNRLEQDLSDVLKDYQFTHQLEESGELNRSTVNSLNRSVETRLGEIATAMQTWRENPIGRHHAGYRVEINIPDFHAEVWDGEELLSRFRVIVGLFSEEDAEMETKTILFSDTISQIVLNPYWNVPQSIVKHELRLKVKKNRNYYAENNYEVRRFRSRDNVRQLPGPDNALGRVKFLFPNEFAIYMHDTPESDRRLFSRNIRAYSHGCIRVQDPMDFAELLISRDRDWSLQKTKDFLEETYAANEGEEVEIDLGHVVPVHIYYTPVNVVDGRPHFLADIYDRTTDAVEENAAHVPEWLEPVAVEETPVVEETPDVVDES